MEDDVAAPQETFDTAGNDWGVVPEDFCSALRPYLLDWPGMNTMRKWIWMQEIYYHAVPADAKDWARKTQPECRRGRIAFLKREKLFSYVYHHRAIVEEGLLLGDRYQYIALDENILFSYFEEPRINVNIKNDYEKESKAIDAWMAVEPESHFLRSGKGNFFFIPMVFCVYRA